MALSRAHVRGTLVAVVTCAACGPTIPTENPGGPPELQPVRVLNTDASKVRGEIQLAAIAYAKQKVEKLSTDDDWIVRSSRADVDGLHHVRMAQFHAGVRVFGGDVVVHSDLATFDTLSGNVVTNLGNFDVVPAIDGDRALAMARSDYTTKAKDPAAALEFARESSDLVILPATTGRQAHLAWHVQFFTELQAGVVPGLWNYFIDARTGELLQQFNGLDTLSQASGPGGNAKVPRTWVAQLDVEPSGSQFQMNTARLQTVNMNHATTGTGTIVVGPLANIGDAPINDAHGFAEETLNQLQDWQGYNSIDNAGFVIRSRVHYSTNYENAFWDGTQMTYGDGATTFFPLSGAVDVAAHEIDHGFTSFHSDLIYSNQSGGMNESFSDIAGEVTETRLKNTSPDWDVGRDIFRGNSALRFMCNPTADGVSIDNAANMTPTLDPHFSSGVMNKAFCLTAKRFGSGSPTGTATVASVKRASNAWYLANAQFWVAGSTFVQGCQGVFDAATSLGFSTTELSQIRQSWLDVGVTCGTGPANQAPTAMITAPANGSTVTGVVTVSATASDADGTVASVRFNFPDGTSVTDTTAPYSTTWNTAGTANGAGKVITATATDNLGLQGAPATINVTVSNGGGGGCVGGTFNAAGLPLAIPDANATGITSPLVVTGSGNIATLALSLNISHTFRGDLAVTLIAPNGAQFVVSNRVGGNADNLVLVNSAVTAFNGAAAAGTWQLKVQDLAAIDVGALNSWSLAITGACGGGGAWSASATPNAPTVDNGSVCNTVTVTTAGDASAAKLDVSGRHDWRSILRGTLAHNGVTVAAFPTGTFPNNTGTFSFASRAIAGLSGDASGAWTLCVIDTDGFGDTGTLNSWSIHN